MWLCFKRGGRLIKRKKSEGDRDTRAGEESQKEKLLERVKPGE